MMRKQPRNVDVLGHKRQLPSCLASNDTGSGTMHAAGVLEDVVLLFGFCE